MFVMPVPPYAHCPDNIAPDLAGRSLNERSINLDAPLPGQDKCKGTVETIFNG
jgi:hypothetical protein